MIGAYFDWYLVDVGGPALSAVAVLPAVAGSPAWPVSSPIGLLFRFTRNNLVNGLLVSIGLISIIEAGALLLWTATPKNMSFVLHRRRATSARSALPKMKLVGLRAARAGHLR